MPLRIGFDMDGVLADFGQAFREMEIRLYGTGGLSAGQPEKEEEAQSSAAPASSRDAEETDLTSTEPVLDRASSRERRRRRDIVWRSIQSTPNFWATLKPTEEGAVRRIHTLMLRHRWEVFFITQRPRTDGDTVQRQTQNWLVEQGYDLPSVLVLGGSRGAAAGALRLNYHVDDSVQNCLDVLSESRANPILIVPDNDDATVAAARKLGIGTARSIGQGLDILDQATAAQAEPRLLRRIAEMVGWRAD
jgi:hypothetical protein